MINSNGEITSEQLKTILDKYFTEVPETLPTDETELKNLELISKDGGYPIKVGEIWTETPSDVSVTIPEGETLEKGKIVTGSNAEWEDDTNEYPAIIPVGFCVVTDAETIAQGLVISDIEGDDMANSKYGNQFVWIPVNDYSKFHLIEGYYNKELQNYLSQATYPAREAGDAEIAGSPLAKNSTVGTAESIAMYQSVKDNKGFYIARYEAGIVGTTCNGSLLEEKSADGTIKPLSKKGVGVWNLIPWGGTQSDTASDGMPGDDTADGAVKVARSMYTKSVTCGVTSTLCYGVQWDAVMNFIDENYVKEEGNLTSFVANSEGKGADSGNLETTGYYAEKNIYDLAGNVCEWTMEIYYDSYRVVRGNGYYDSGAILPPSYRSEFYLPEELAFNTGFRVALYL